MFLRKMGSLAMMFAAVGLIACSGDSSKSVSTAPAVEEDSGKTTLPDSVKVDPDNHDANPSQGISDEDDPVAPGILDDDDDEGSDEPWAAEETQEPISPEEDDPDDVASSEDESAETARRKNVVSGKYSCTVTSTSNSVKVDQRIEGMASYVSTVSGRDGRLSIETEMWYADAEFAKNFCENWKEEAEHWNGSMTVTCSSNTIKTSEYDEGSLSGHQKEFEELCDDGKEEYESGEYDEYI